MGWVVSVGAVAGRAGGGVGGGGDTAGVGVQAASRSRRIERRMFGKLCTVLCIVVWYMREELHSAGGKLTKDKYSLSAC